MFLKAGKAICLPDRTSTTMIMYLNNHLFSKNYGMAGAVSVVLLDRKSTR